MKIGIDISTLNSFFDANPISFNEYTYLDDLMNARMEGFVSTPLSSHAKEFIESIVSKGYDVVLIAPKAYEDTSSDYGRMYTRWLEKTGIGKGHTVFTDDDQAILCETEKLDVLVDAFIGFEDEDVKDLEREIGDTKLIRFDDQFNTATIDADVSSLTDALPIIDREYQIRELKRLKDSIAPQEQAPKKRLPSVEKPWRKYYSEEALAAELPKMKAYDYMCSQNAERIHNTALNYFGREIAYEQMFEKIEETAKAFAQMGVKKGDIVTFCMPTTPETIYSFYALNRLGAIANFVDPRTSEKGIEEYLEESESSIVVTIDLLKDRIAKLSYKTNLRIDKIVSVSPSDSLPFGMKELYNLKSYIDRKKSGTSQVELPETVVHYDWPRFMKLGCDYRGLIDANYEPNMPAAIVHTGGTTGTPKGVALSNDNLNALAFQYGVSGMELLPTQKFLNNMPPFIAYGIGNGIHMPLCQGMVDIIIPKFEAEKFENYILKYKPNTIMGVPSHLRPLIESKKLRYRQTPYLVNIGVGGDSLDTTLEVKTNNWLKEHGSKAKVTKGYGATEGSSADCVPIQENNKIGSVGFPFVGNEVKIIGYEKQDDGRVVYYPDDEKTYDEQGAICLSGPTTMLHYYKKPKETEQMLVRHSDGKVWIQTGDIGHIDEDGMVFVDGRIKDMIILNTGFKTFSSVMANVIATHPSVETCAVVGIPDPEYPEDSAIPKAHIVLNEDSKGREKEIEEEIRTICSENLADYSVPQVYKFRDSLPMTPLGKTDLKALRNEDVLSQEHDKTQDPEVEETGITKRLTR